MAKKKQLISPVSEITDLMKKLLALELIKAGVSKEGVREKLHIDANALSVFLKGVKVIKTEIKFSNSKKVKK